jgi:hypothetical protein
MREFMARTANLNRVINCDEICWCVHPDGQKTYAPSGSDNVVISIVVHEKESFTALCSITAARRKLPIGMIEKGKSTPVEKSQLDEIESAIPMHSEYGCFAI